jgi:hypothetical protein
MSFMSSFEKRMGRYNLKWKRRVAFVLLFCEIAWACTWFGGMLAYNLVPGADEHFEQSHFDSILHVTAYPFVVATWVALVNGAKRKELADIRLLLFGLIFAGFSDARGPVHAARVLPHTGWEWPLFTAVASMALSLTGLEILWFIWVTWELWNDAPGEIAGIWSGPEKERRPREKTRYQEVLLPLAKTGTVLKY